MQGCQVDSTNLLYFNIGDADKVEFSMDGNDVVGTYTLDDSSRLVLHDPQRVEVDFWSVPYNRPASPSAIRKKKKKKKKSFRDQFAKIAHYS